MKKQIIATLLLFSCVSTCWAFNGERKGFILGGGIGYTADSKWEVDGTSLISESNTGYGIILAVGYAWNKNNMVLYESNTVRNNSKVLQADVFQGYWGVSWYHYFGEVGKTIFTVVGVGTYSFEPDDYDPHDRGIGLMTGFGYEFIKHLQIGAYFSYGKTTDSNFDYNHNHLNIIVSGFAF